MRDDHIRSADFFDAENHPTMTFISTAVRAEDGDFFIDGDLTIRGITKQVTLAVDTPAFGPAPGQPEGRVLGDHRDEPHDFGVSYNGPIPGGGMALGDGCRSCWTSRPTSPPDRTPAPPLAGTSPRVPSGRHRPALSTEPPEEPLAGSHRLRLRFRDSSAIGLRGVATTCSSRNSTRTPPIASSTDPTW